MERPSWRNALGVALIVEAFISPIAWLGTFSATTFVAGGDSMGQRLADLMRRLGNIGPLVLFVVLLGAAVIVLAHPIKDGWLPASICFVAAACNLLPALWFLSYSAVISTGPGATRMAGIVFGALPLALVAAGLIAEGIRSARAGGEHPAAATPAGM